jgi:hypothetical protein
MVTDIEISADAWKLPYVTYCTTVSYMDGGWGGIRTCGTNGRRPLDSILVQATVDKYLNDGTWKLVDIFGCYHYCYQQANGKYRPKAAQQVLVRLFPRPARAATP